MPTAQELLAKFNNNTDTQPAQPAAVTAQDLLAKFAQDDQPASQISSQINSQIASQTMQNLAVAADNAELSPGQQIKQQPEPTLEDFATELITEPIDRKQIDPVEMITPKVPQIEYSPAVMAGLKPEHTAKLNEYYNMVQPDTGGDIQKAMARLYDNTLYEKMTVEGEPQKSVFSAFSAGGMPSTYTTGRLMNESERGQQMASDIAMVKQYLDNPGQYSDLVTQGFAPDQIKAWELQGDITAGESVDKMTGKDWAEKVPLIGTVAAIKNSAELYEAVGRLEDPAKYSKMQVGTGQYSKFPSNTVTGQSGQSTRDMSEDEQIAQMQNDMELVDEYLAKRAELEVRGTSIGADVLQGVLELPDFMATFALSGPLGATAKKGAGKFVLNQAVKRMGKRKVLDLLKKKGVKVGLKVLGSMIDAGARMPIQAPEIGASTLERNLDSGEFALTDKGVEYFREPENISTSMVKAAKDMYIENFSEVSGPGISKVTGAIGKATGKGLNQMPGGEKITKLFKGIEKAFKGEYPDSNFSEFMKNKARFGGFLEEMGEEYWGDLLRTTFNIEGEDSDFGQRMGDYVKRNTDLRNFMVQAGILTAPGGVMTATNMVQQRHNNKLDDKAIQRAAGRQEKYSDMNYQGMDEEDSAGQIYNNAAHMANANQTHKDQVSQIMQPLLGRLKLHGNEDGFGYGRLNARNKGTAVKVADMFNSAYNNADATVKQSGGGWTVTVRFADWIDRTSGRGISESIDTNTDLDVIDFGVVDDLPEESPDYDPGDGIEIEYDPELNKPDVFLEDELVSSADTSDWQMIDNLELELEDITEGADEDTAQRAQAVYATVRKKKLEVPKAQQITIDQDGLPVLADEIDQPQQPEQFETNTYEGKFGDQRLTYMQLERLQKTTDHKGVTMYVKLNKAGKPYITSKRPAREPFLILEPANNKVEEEPKPDEKTEVPEDKTKKADSEKTAVPAKAVQASANDGHMADLADKVASGQMKRLQQNMQKPADKADSVSAEIKEIESKLWQFDMQDRQTDSQRKIIRRLNDRLRELKTQPGPEQPSASSKHILTKDSEDKDIVEVVSNGGQIEYQDIGYSVKQTPDGKWIAVEHSKHANQEIGMFGKLEKRSHAVDLLVEEMQEYRDEVKTDHPDETQTDPEVKADDNGIEFTTLPSAVISADPDRFQYKADTSGPEGVSQKLQSVEKWNPQAAGIMLVWQERGGKYFVVDGHHRLSLAKKLDVNKLNVHILREEDGVTAEMARVFGAMSNLADEKGTAIDAAKIFRDTDMTIDQLKDEGVDIRSSIVSQGLAMKNLSDEVFGMVVDEKIPANMAAKIGEFVESPENQSKAADLIAQGDIKTAREAEILARTIDKAPVLTRSQMTLFGEESWQDNLFAERAKLLAHIEKKLKEDKKVFGVLQEKSDKIEGKGNKLNKQANSETRDRADEMLYLLDKLADRVGPVYEELNNATIRYAKEPGKLNSIATELIEYWKDTLKVRTRKEVPKGVSGAKTQKQSEAEPADRIEDNRTVEQEKKETSADISKEIGYSLRKIAEAVIPNSKVELEDAVRTLADDVDGLVKQGKLSAEKRDSFIEQKLAEAGLAGADPAEIDAPGRNYIANEKAVISLAIRNSDPTTAIHEAVETRIKNYFDGQDIDKHQELNSFRRQIEDLGLKAYQNDKSNLEWFSEFMTDYVFAGQKRRLDNDDKNAQAIWDAVIKWNSLAKEGSYLSRLFDNVRQWFKDTISRARKLRKALYSNPGQVDLILADDVLNSVPGRQESQSQTIDIENPDISYQLRRRSYSKDTAAKIEVLPEDTFEAYQKYKDTNWGRAVAKRAVVRNEIIDILNNKQPETDIVKSKNEKLYNLLQQDGSEGVFKYIAETGVLGKAGKPTIAVNSSLANCNPSKDCAKYCYATGGNYSYSGPMIKSEIVDMAAAIDPQRLGGMIAGQYQLTPNFDADKALRFNDIGDLNEAWVKVINEVNNNGVRCQVFSKRPELLAKIDKRNVRLLSIDRTNTDIADGNDLPLAVTYQGSDDLDILTKYSDRIQVILPIKIGKKLLTKNEINVIPETLQPYVCPVDSGKKQLAAKGTNSGWVCTKCDREGQGLGCFFKNEGSFIGNEIEVLLTKLEKALHNEGINRSDAENLIAEFKRHRETVAGRQGREGTTEDTVSQGHNRAEIGSLRGGRGVSGGGNLEVADKFQEPADSQLAEALAGSKLSVDTLAKAFGVSPGNVSETKSGVFIVELPNGKVVQVDNAGFIEGPDGDNSYRGLWRNLPGSITLADGRSVDFDGMIRLSAYFATDDTLPHEQFHAAMDMALTEKERSVVLNRFNGDEERAAESYGRWAAGRDKKGYPYFNKVRDFFRRIWVAITGRQDIGDIFKQVYSGRIWQQSAQEGSDIIEDQYQPSKGRDPKKMVGKGPEKVTKRYIEKLGKTWGKKHKQPPEKNRQQMIDRQRNYDGRPSARQLFKDNALNKFQQMTALAGKIVDVLEPNKKAQKSFGYDTVAEIVKMAAAPEAGQLEYGQTMLDSMEMSYRQLAEAIDSLPARQKKYIYHYRGQAKTKGGRYLQGIARKNISAKAKQYAGYLDQMYDTAYKLLDGLGFDAMYFTDYFYGAYTDMTKAQEVLGKYYPTTKRMLKTKVIPTVADANALGLKLQDDNPALNAFREVGAIWRLAAMQRWRDYLIENHYETGIIRAGEASEYHVKEWRKLYLQKDSSTVEPVFNGYLLHPDLFRPTSALNSINATGKGGWRFFRTWVHRVNGLKFLLPIHHLRTIASQAIVDSGGMMGMFKPSTWGKLFTYKISNELERSKGYKEYVSLGGGHNSSMEIESRQALKKWLAQESKWYVQLAKMPVKLADMTTGRFTRWVFEKYIPAIKYAKFIQEVDALREKLGREPSDAEKIEIIKIGQNFYGEMNEKLFGRSATVTSAMRFVFLAPGFREGNYRTMLRGLDAASYNKHGGPQGRDMRSLRNIPMFLTLSAIIANIGTLILTGELPDGPEEGEYCEEWLRDMFKIDTGQTDDKGRPIMVDIMTTDKDYYQQIVQPFIELITGRPAEAAGSAIYTMTHTIGGMTSVPRAIINDLDAVAQGKVLVDWKGDRVWYSSDSGLTKINKFLLHEARHIEPIPVSSARNMHRRGLDAMTSLLAAGAAMRVSSSELERRRSELWQKFFDMRDRRTELRKIAKNGRLDQSEIDYFNYIVDEALRVKALPVDLKDYLEGLRLPDLKELLGSIDDYDNRTLKKKIRILKKAGKTNEAIRQINLYNKEHPYGRVIGK